MSRVASLARLQELDLEADRLASRRRELEQMLASDENGRAARDTAASAEARAELARKAARISELEVASVRSKFEDTERRLYGGTVQVPKELQDLQREAESLARHLQSLEDGLLQSMIDAEDAEAVLQGAGSRLKEAEQERSEQVTGWERDLGSIQAQMERLEDERQAAEGDVLPGDLSLYRDLRQRLGRAVAELQDDSCGACGLILSASLPQLVRQATEITRCPQCGRILYAG